MFEYPLSSKNCGKFVAQALLDFHDKPVPPLQEVTSADRRWIHLLLSLTGGFLTTSILKVCSAGGVQLRTFVADEKNNQLAVDSLTEALQRGPVILSVRNKRGGKSPHWVVVYGWRGTTLSVYDSSPKTKIVPGLPYGNTIWNLEELFQRWEVPEWVYRICSRREMPGRRFGLTVM